MRFKIFIYNHFLFHALYIAAFLFFISFHSMVFANPLAPGWDLDPENSEITFSSVKYEDGKKVAETHSFATFTGALEENGTAQIVVKMDSVDTNNDLRNVRMRFLFFESFKFPDGIVTLQVTEDMVQGLAAGSRKAVTVPFDLNIKDVVNQLEADTVVSVIDDNAFSISSSAPIIFRVEEFGLGNNLRKIAETAGGFDIVPTMQLNFELTFTRRATGQAPVEVATETAPQTEPQPEAAAEPPVVVAEAPPAAAALETKGDFSLEECVGRFEILSETGNIYFASGSARLQDDSYFVLRSVLDIVQRCPDLRILVSGHTDSDGSENYNQSLSELRARSVRQYLVGQGVNAFRLITTGFGELQPMVPNDSDFNKSRNRRIEFSLFR